MTTSTSSTGLGARVRSVYRRMVLPFYVHPEAGELAGAAVFVAAADAAIRMPASWIGAQVAVAAGGAAYAAVQRRREARKDRTLD